MPSDGSVKSRWRFFYLQPRELTGSLLNQSIPFQIQFLVSRHKSDHEIQFLSLIDWSDLLKRFFLTGHQLICEAQQSSIR